MAWEKINLMFPSNRLAQNEPVNLEELNNYDVISWQTIQYARDMAIKKEKLTWTSDNKFIVETLYDANEFNNVPGNISCLNVYGNRMVLDYFTRAEYKSRRYSGEAQHAGFSYTGL